MPLSRAQFIAKLERIKRKIKATKIDDDVSVAVLNVAVSTMEVFAPEEASASTSEQTSFSLPDEDDVLSFIQDSLPAPSAIFVESFYTCPLFSFTILKEVYDLLGCPSTAANFLNSVRLSRDEKQNRRILLIVWLTWILQCDVSFCQSVVNRFKHSRSSSPPATDGSTANEGVEEQPLAADIQPENHRSQRGQVQNPPQAQQEMFREDVHVNNEHPPGPPHFAQRGNTQDMKKASYVQMMFKDSKFKGKLSQDITESLKLYSICSRQYGLSRVQKADFFIHVLDGAARKFFLENVDETLPYNEMVNIMVKEYMSDARQMQVKGTLETLRLKTFMSEKGLSDVSEGLTKIVEHINELSPQCPREFRADAHKIDYLRKAVTEFHDWSRIPIQSITSQGFSFNMFVTTLHESIQNLRQIQIITGNNGGGEYGTNLMQYGGNSLKGNSTYRGNFTGGRKVTTAFEEARRKNECHKCGAPNWSRQHRCSKGAIQARARQRLSNGESSIHLVADLVHQMEGDLDDDGRNETQPETSQEVAVFDAMFSSDFQEDEPPDVNDAIELADESILINQLSASFNDTSDFLSGDVEK